MISNCLFDSPPLITGDLLPFPFLSFSLCWLSAPVQKEALHFQSDQSGKGNEGEGENTFFGICFSSLLFNSCADLPSPLLASVYNHKLNTLIEMRSLWGSTRASRAGLTDGRHSSIPLPPEGGNRPCCDIGSLARGGGGGGEWGAIKGNIVVACLPPCLERGSDCVWPSAVASSSSWLLLTSLLGTHNARLIYDFCRHRKGRTETALLAGGRKEERGQQTSLPSSFLTLTLDIGGGGRQR